MTVKFTLRTKDAKWIAAHAGVTSADGWTAVQVPAEKVEEVTFMGKTWLRVQFGKDAPKDAEMSLIMSPVLFMK